MNDPELKHDDGCRCQGCCREKFKTIDPALVGKAPRLPADSQWLQGVPQQRPVLPED